MAALKLLALATALSGFFVCTQVWAEPVRFGVATEPFPPFTKKDDSGHWVGFEMDLLVAICARMKAQCVVVETPWKGIIPALNAGKFDIIWSSMTITPHRQEAIDFSDRYYWLPIVVVGPRSLSVTIDFSNPNSVRGRSIGTLAPSYNFLFLQKAFGTVPILVPCHLTLDCINELNAGHIDLMMTDALGASDYLSSPAGKQMEIKAKAPRDPMLGLGVGAGFRKGDTELRARFNTALKAIRDDGTYRAIAARYFDFDPYGE